MGAWETYEETMGVPPSLWSAAKANDVRLIASLLLDARAFPLTFGRTEVVELLEQTR